MKKILLSFAAVAAFAATANAQAQRMALYEEFTGEDCAPCSAANPALVALMSASGNDGVKVQMLSFQEPIPHLGFIYYQSQAVSDARIQYYGSTGPTAITGTPTGLMDGALTNPTMSYSGAPENMTQANIDAAAAVTSPFSITVNSVWNATYTQVTSTIIVTPVGAYAPAGGSIKLRVALVESLHYTTAPGITGEGTEKDFFNVVRAMYPNAAGTALPATWTAGGAAQTYTIVGTVPPSVDLRGKPFVVAWIQNDNDKSVAQTAKGNIFSLPTQAVDAAIDSSTTTVLACGGTGSVTGILHNYGTSTLTSATIYTKVNTGLTNGTWTSHAWTGSLAAGATVPVTYTVSGIPVYGGSGSNYNRVYDSVAATGDLNYGNNANYGNAFTVATATSFTIDTASFETGLPSGWIIEDGLVKDYETGTSAMLGHNGSQFALGIANFNYPNGTNDYVILPALGKPTSGKTSMDFYYAYAQQTSANTDALDVVLSTDCGATWTSLWHKSGAALATAAASAINFSNGAGLFIPSSNSQYAHGDVDLTSAAANSLVAFKFTTGGGNYLFVDDVDIVNKNLSVANVSPATSNVSLYPNPAKENATLELTLAANTNVHVDVVDAIGRTVAVAANQNMAAGTQKINISTAALATGIYNVRIVTDAGTTTQRLSVVK